VEQSEVLLDRIRSARKAAGLTQEDVATLVGLARTTVVAIEKGERQITPAELVAFAKALNRPVSDLVRPTPIAADFAAQFRLRPESRPNDRDLGSAVQLLQDLADDYVTLERLAGASLTRRYPAEVDVSMAAPRQAGETLAASERNRLGLGDAPVQDLREVLESDVGLRVFALELPASVAGLFVYTVDYGGCVAINRNHPAERQRWSLAHEYAHFLALRSRTEVTVLGGHTRVPAEERFADAFAESFLMPATGLSRRFQEFRRGPAGAVTPADLLHLADRFQVSFQALVLRLETLDLVSSGTWNSLHSQGFRVEEARDLLRLMPLQPDTEMLPTRFRYLAAEAYRAGELSEGQLARLLRVDRTEARQLVQHLEQRVDIEASGELSAMEFNTPGRLTTVDI
jgi:Zn-dependent peptidase ImmA (M78 family)/transcriptional regulator with XRE-family HTH domain